MSVLARFPSRQFTSTTVLGAGKSNRGFGRLLSSGVWTRRRPRHRPGRAAQSADLLYGRHSVLAALSLSHRKHRRLLIDSDLFELVDRAREREAQDRRRADVLGGSNGRERRLSADEQKVVAYLDRLEDVTPEAVAVKRVSRRDLQDIVGAGRSAQGIALETSSLRLPVADEDGKWLKSLESSADNIAHRPVILALDGVTDPQNVGALLRTSYLLAVSGVVASGIGSALASASVASGRRRGDQGGGDSSDRRPRAGVISHVSKASAGALEVLCARGAVATTRGSSLAPFLRSAAAGGWNVVAAMLPSAADEGGFDGKIGARAVPLSSFSVPRVPEVHKEGTNTGTVLVLGSEGAGVSPAAAKVCADSGGFVFIETAPSFEESEVGDLVDSFNVSVAGAILLHRLVQESVN